MNALRFRGVCKVGLGDGPGGLADLDRAVQLAPENGMAWASRGEVRAGLGDPRGALADLDAALRLLPPGAQLRPALESLREEVRARLR